MKKAQTINQYIIEMDMNVYDALVKFEINNVHTLLVKNSKKIVGSITDGDIRKALINSRTLNTQIRDIMNRDYIYAESEMNAKMLFDRYEYITLIPVLNVERELISIYLRF